jgi:hypothetical protein
VAQAWLERVRRSTPWRCWVRGTQVFFAGFGLVAVAVGLAVLSAPRALVEVVALSSFCIAFLGFGAAFVGMILLGVGHREMFNAHSLSVSGALAKDLFRFRAPQPFAEPPWPPPQWQPTTFRTASTETHGAGRSHDDLPPG